MPRPARPHQARVRRTDVRIDKEAATDVFGRAVALADAGLSSPRWEAHVRSVSKLCEATPRTPKTHITFLGTVLLAKATEPLVDVFALKVRAGTPGAYSARAVAQHALVPQARHFRVNVGVTGREPLNNQPYFQHQTLSRSITVHSNAREAFAAVCDMLDELAELGDPADILAALAAYIKVRREYWQEPEAYATPSGAVALPALIQKILAFVHEDAEGDRRAQAVAAGLMDVVHDYRTVKTSRINDPDRNFPGDVAVFLRRGSRRLLRVLEVRDKAVSESDLAAFAIKVAKFSVPHAAVLAVDPKQEALDVRAFEPTVPDASLEVFEGWASYIRQVFFWKRAEVSDSVQLAHKRIYRRLVELEASSLAQESWLKWTP